MLGPGCLTCLALLRKVSNEKDEGFVASWGRLHHTLVIVAEDRTELSEDEHMICTAPERDRGSKSKGFGGFRRRTFAPFQKQRMAEKNNRLLARLAARGQGKWQMGGEVVSNRR